MKVEMAQCRNVVFLCVQWNWILDPLGPVSSVEINEANGERCDLFMSLLCHLRESMNLPTVCASQTANRWTWILIKAIPRRENLQRVFTAVLYFPTAFSQTKTFSFCGGDNKKLNQNQFIAWDPKSLFPLIRLKILG